MPKLRIGIIPAAYAPARDGTHDAYRVEVFTARNRYMKPDRARRVIARDPFRTFRGMKYDFGTANPITKEDQ